MTAVQMRSRTTCCRSSLPITSSSWLIGSTPGTTPERPPCWPPRCLLIFERLERDPDRLRDLWQRRRSLDELEELASAYGLPI